MTTRIGLLGDLHAIAAPVMEALELFRDQGVDAIWCTGDVAGYGDQLEQTIGLLQADDCRVILGNHDLWYLERPSSEQDALAAAYLATLSQVHESVIEGRRLYMVHASPPRSLMDGIRLLDESGRILPEQQDAWRDRLSGFSADVLIVGHTHQVFAEQLGGTLVINPGSTLFNHACAILSLPDRGFELYGLSGRQPVRAWHWGQPGQQWP